LDLVIGEGELFVIVGPSGCGKTSLLRMVAGLESVTAGDILMDGVRVNDVPTNERDIAMTFQQYSLYPNLTVADNIGFPLKIDRVDRATLERRVAEVAGVLHLTDVLDRLPARLSGGQQQRVAMGRAIVRDPRLLLMDEPMSNLDAKLRTETRSVIIGIQRSLGVTTMYVTHDQVEAMAMGDRLAVMRYGRIVQCGRPIDVYEEPSSIFVATFIGAPAINVIKATVVMFDDALALRIGSHHVPVGDQALRRLPLVRQMVGRAVGLGVRPDALFQDPAGPLLLSVLSTEHDELAKFVQLEIDAPAVTSTNDRIVVESHPSSAIVMSVKPAVVVSLWEPVHVDIDTTRIHLFDLSTGDSIGRA
jgi:multiple sugar transport system ATP-binding protein